jgi:hypothetical protein
VPVRWSVDCSAAEAGWSGSRNSDHVIVAANRVMTGERRAWRKEEVASEEIGTALGGGRAGRTQRRR